MDLQKPLKVDRFEAVLDPPGTNLDARAECESAAALLGLPPLPGGGRRNNGERQRRHRDRLREREKGILKIKQ